MSFQRELAHASFQVVHLRALLGSTSYLQDLASNNVWGRYFLKTSLIIVFFKASMALAYLFTMRLRPQQQHHLAALHRFSQETWKEGRSNFSLFNL